MVPDPLVRGRPDPHEFPKSHLPISTVGFIVIDRTNEQHTIKIAKASLQSPHFAATTGAR
jgi:hypothetical protein